MVIQILCQTQKISFLALVYARQLPKWQKYTAKTMSVGMPIPLKIVRTRARSRAT